MKKINQYGDAQLFLAAGHGADIASQRADDLDTMAIEYATSMKSTFAIDIGCGAGGQAIRLAQQGATVMALDIVDMKETIASAIANMPELSGQVAFSQIDMRHLDQLPVAVLADVIICQRAIHYLPFPEAVHVISSMSRLLAPKGRLYLSASGINSELGDGYTAKRTKLSTRFAELAPEMRDKHGIHAPVCLYCEDDLEYLLFMSGLAPQTLFSSKFGNIKVVAKHA